jgi:hypothetical protein
VRRKEWFSSALLANIALMEIFGALPMAQRMSRAPPKFTPEQPVTPKEA